jgi:hypothetical protein
MEPFLSAPPLIAWERRACGEGSRRHAPIGGVAPVDRGRGGVVATRAMVAAFAALAACGDGGGAGSAFDAAPMAPDDAHPPYECWPVEGTVPRGSIQLGTGTGGFAERGATSPLVFGSLGGFHLEVHARIVGLAPGDPTNPLSADNPRTRFSAAFADSGALVTDGPTCAMSVGYAPADEADTFDLARGSALVFDTAYQKSELFGRTLRVSVEIVDAEGGYAIDERLVTAEQPLDWADAGPPP